MGREQRRKEAKRNGKNIKEIKKNEEKNEIKGLDVLKITIIVLGLLGILYLVLAIFVTKELDLSTKKDSEEETTESASSVSGAILAENTFNQSGDNYYVLFYNFEDEDETNLASSVSSNLTDKKIYKVNTNDGLNSNFVTKDTSNPNAKSKEELKIKSPTLITVSADSISEYIEGTDNIKSYLNK